jgi:hypothetical protein
LFNQFNQKVHGSIYRRHAATQQAWFFVELGVPFGFPLLPEPAATPTPGAFGRAGPGVVCFTCAAACAANFSSFLAFSCHVVLKPRETAKKLQNRPNHGNLTDLTEKKWKN